MNSNAKHILFLPRWYPHRQDTMFGLFVKKHAEAVSLFNSVSVLYVQGVASKERFERIQTIEAPNLFTIIYYYRISKCKLWNIIRYWYFLIIGFRYMHKTKGLPDLIHVHVLTRLALFALLLKIIYKKPYVVTEHWSRYLPSSETYTGSIRKYLTRIVVKSAAAVLPVSKLLAEAMQAHNLKNAHYHIVPNVVEDIFFQNFETESTSDKVMFLHVSTFEDRSKNISGILRVIKQLADFSTNFEFWFVGDGIDFAAMKNYAKELLIPEDAIRFYGLIKGRSLAEKYKQADYLVMFSNYETFLVVFYEAQASGLAVVTTRVGELADYINETNGYMIEPKREDQLLSVLKTILVEHPLFSKELIRKQTHNIYSYAEVGKQLDEIYCQSI